MDVPQLWVTAGFVLLIIELIGVPGFVFGSVGLGAMATSILALFAPMPVQWIFWAILSCFTIWMSRKFVPKDVFELDESTEAFSLADIPPGKKGRVRYAGSIWNAKCAVDDMSIPAGKELVVIDRKGNVLIVLPEGFTADLGATT